MRQLLLNLWIKFKDIHSLFAILQQCVIQQDYVINAMQTDLLSKIYTLFLLLLELYQMLGVNF